MSSFFFRCYTIICLRFSSRFPAEELAGEYKRLLFSTELTDRYNLVAVKRYFLFQFSQIGGTRLGNQTSVKLKRCIIIWQGLRNKIAGSLITKFTET